MIIFESIRIALDMLRLHKLRAFLTMLGVIIGVMSVSLIIILVNGFKSFIEQQFSGLAADGIYIVYDPSRMERGQSAGGIDGVDEEVKRYLETRAQKIQVVSGMVEAGNHSVRFGSEEVKGVKVLAVDGNTPEIIKKEIVKGRLVNQADLDSRANVGVISEELATELFGTDEALGQYIQLPGLNLEVVGVMKKPPQIGGPPSTNVIEIPVTTAQRKWLGGREYTYLMARAADGVPVSEAMDEVWQLMMQYSNNRQLFAVDSNESILKVFSGIIGGVGGVLAAVAALSLLVGGIGIMNIMLVSVTERTREIGLRKAVGAKRQSILLQFLVEAGMLSLVGGIIGMVCAYGLGLIATLITKQLGFPDENGLSAPFPVMEAIFAAGFSAAIGMVFGFFPAVSAAKLDPIVALRYE